MEKGKVSVVIPVLNGYPFILEAINSVLGQTFKNLEIIVVDNGSSDGTMAAVEEEFGSRVRVSRNLKTGVSSARNKGFDLSTGEYVAYLDADDIWEPRKLEIQTALMSRFSRCGLCYSDAYRGGRGRTRGRTDPVYRENFFGYSDIFSERHDLELEISGGREKLTVYKGDIFRYLIYNGMILPSAVLTRKRTAVDNDIRWNELFNFTGSGDADYFLRFSRRTEVIYIDSPLLVYRDVNRGTRFSDSIRNSRRIMAFYSSIMRNVVLDREYYRKNRRWVDRCLYRLFLRKAYYHISEVERGRAFRALISAVRFARIPVKAVLLAPLCFVPDVLIRGLGEFKKAVKRR